MAEACQKQVLQLVPKLQDGDYDALLDVHYD